MPTFDLAPVDGSGAGVPLLRVDVDPSQFGGGRTAFGPFFTFALRWSYEERYRGARPLTIQGVLSWAGEHDGLRIPQQAVLPNESLRVSLSADQVARIEERRAGAEPQLALRIEVLAQKQDGVVIALGHGSYALPLALSRDNWLRVVDQFCSLGQRHIVELPVAPAGAGGAWAEAARDLATASQRLANGLDAEAIGAIRRAMERIAEAVGAAVGTEREAREPFKPYVTKVAAAIAKIPGDGAHQPFPLVAELLKATFSWSSEPVHRDAGVSLREQARFALSLATSLYGLTVRGDVAVFAALTPAAAGGPTADASRSV